MSSSDELIEIARIATAAEQIAGALARIATVYERESAKSADRKDPLQTLARDFAAIRGRQAAVTLDPVGDPAGG